MPKTSYPRKIFGYVILFPLCSFTACHSSYKPSSPSNITHNQSENTAQNARLLLAKTTFSTDFSYYNFTNESEIKQLIAMFTPPKRTSSDVNTTVTPARCGDIFPPEFKILENYTHNSVAMLADKNITGKPSSTMDIEILIHDAVDYQILENTYKNGICTNITYASKNFPHTGDTTMMHILTKVESPLTHEKSLIFSQLAQGNCPAGTINPMAQSQYIKIYTKLGFVTVNNTYSLIFEQSS